MSLVTVAEAKAHVKVTNSAVDAAVQIVLDGAEQWIEQHLGISLNKAAVTDEYVDAVGFVLQPLEKLPIDSTQDVTVFDSYSNDYEYTKIVVRDNAIERKLGLLWPAGSARYKVSYTGGYDVNTLPFGLKACILELFARAWERRSGEASTGGEISASWPMLMDADVYMKLEDYRPAGLF